MSQKAFSKIWVLIIIAAIVAGGVLAWQYLGVSKQEAGVLETEGTETGQDWITGGSRTSAILVKPSKKMVKPGEEFSVAVDSWTFNPSGKPAEDYNEYFRLYNTNNPDKMILLKRTLSHQKKDDWYARIKPFEWVIQAPQQPGDYTYRIVEKPKSWPSFDNYAKKVEFGVSVSR